ncbi:MAG: sialidase family protein [Brevundimonas sp.]|uniref:sialidase family protein n=1 Tax=Brevundimonas sp. TaxID=1871086 RepID=UPI004034E7D4
MADWTRRGLASATAAAGLTLGASRVRAAPNETGLDATGQAVAASGFIFETAPYPQCHASTLVETASGRLAAAWFGGTHERNPDVEIWFALNDGEHWGVPVSVATGVQADGSRLPTWNPVLFQPPGAPLTLFYKVGPSPQSWWGMVMTSDDEGRTWSEPRRLPDGVLGPIKNKPVLLADGAWLSPSSVEAGEGVGAHAGAGWSLIFERSEDQGRTWSLSPPAPSPLNIDAIQPSILFHPDGSLQAVARTRQGMVASTWSRDGGRTWAPLGAVDLPNPNSANDAVTLKDGRHLMIYNHAAHRAETPGKGPRWPLCLALSDDGVGWRRVLTLESEPVRDGYAYPAVIQTRDGMVHATYTHNRTRIRHVVIDPSRLP